MMMNVNSVSNLFTTESDRTIKKELDKEAFLRILTTQLRNQDPLEPMKDQDFIAQMSQLSSVEQIMNMSKSVQTFVDTASQLYRTQSVSMIGKTAVVKTNTIDVNDGTPETKIFNLDSEANVIVQIYDENGKVVNEEHLGQLSEGMQILAWDGKDSSGTKVEDGRYSFKLMKTTTDGTLEEIPCVESGTISGVQFDGNNIKIVINDVVYDISQISEVYA